MSHARARWLALSPATLPTPRGQAQALILHEPPPPHSSSPPSIFVIWVGASPHCGLHPPATGTGLQPFSQKSFTTTVAKEFQIGLYDPAEADLEHFWNCCSAGFLGERLYELTIAERSILADPNRNTNTRGTFSFKLNFFYFSRQSSL